MRGLWCGLVLSVAGFAAEPAYRLAQGVQPPALKREFRGAWIATVGNIDWPSKPGLTTAQQQAELIALFDMASAMNLNAVIFQVRTGCDALYNSRHEPWSEYLTGKMGEPPTPYYDPLDFAVREAHARGLELHAWFNPFRARYHQAKSEVSAGHVSRKQPALVRQYAEWLWLDPGLKAANDISINVMIDVVKRYDVDGIHIDDYFYPYPVKDKAGKLMEFPDDASWNAYRQRGGKLERADWRRENINQFVKRLHTAIHAEKSWVKFGVSPFGIWKDGVPAGIKGFDAHALLYADARLWLQNGWMDYCAPQLYWSIEAPQQSFPVLLKWWSEQNPKQRHLWPGSNSAKVDPWKAEEIAKQIEVTRQNRGATGNVHWNISALSKNKGGLRDHLAAGSYREPALVPATPWLDNVAPPKPAVSAKLDGQSLRVDWRNGGQEPIAQWVLQWRMGQQWQSKVLEGGRPSATLKLEGEQPAFLAVTVIDRAGNASAPAVLERIR
ncbi:MAG: hypothetical protein EXS24_04015 [Pedosphaera sp.]|nr:hypothetical protein [Pedosphaera sp.]